jgi:hypothetical protein
MVCRHAGGRPESYQGEWNMTTYVFCGHGEFSPGGSGSYPAEVLIPPDTTVHFCSDAGQPLMLPTTKTASGDGRRFDYDKVAQEWQKVKDSVPALTALMPAYNYRLLAITPEEREAADKANWSGATPISIDSSRFYLCTDQKGECPTPALLGGAHTEEEISNPERWKHHCDGILGTYGKDGNDLHWIACTVFEMDDVEKAELPPLITAEHKGPGTVPLSNNWIPKESDFEAATVRNSINLEDVINADGKAAVAVGDLMVLIGAGHQAQAAAYVTGVGKKEEGQIAVKQGPFGKVLEVSGLKEADNRDAVQVAITDCLPADQKKTRVKFV